MTDGGVAGAGRALVASAARWRPGASKCVAGMGVASCGGIEGDSLRGSGLSPFPRPGLRVDRRSFPLVPVSLSGRIGLGNDR